MDTNAAALELRRLTRDHLRSLSMAERDRMLQTHLAQARGEQLNALLMRRVTARLLAARRQAGEVGAIE